MILSLGYWIPQHEGRDMAWGATTLNITQHQSISVLPNQTWPIISAALMLLHDQKNEIRVNKVIHLTKSHAACVCQIHKQNENTSVMHLILTYKTGKKKKWIIKFSTQWNTVSLKMLMIISLLWSIPNLHYKHCTQTQEWERKKETQPSVLHPSVVLSSQDCVCQELQCQIPATKNCITVRLHLSIQCRVQMLALIMKRQIPRGMCFSGSTKDKSNPNRTTIDIQKCPCSVGFVEQCSIPIRSLNLTESPGVQKIITVIQYV